MNEKIKNDFDTIQKTDIHTLYYILYPKCSKNILRHKVTIKHFLHFNTKFRTTIFSSISSIRVKSYKPRLNDNLYQENL